MVKFIMAFTSLLFSVAYNLEAQGAFVFQLAVARLSQLWLFSFWLSVVFHTITKNPIIFYIKKKKKGCFVFFSLSH